VIKEDWDTLAEMNRSLDKTAVPLKPVRVEDLEDPNFIISPDNIRTVAGRETMIIELPNGQKQAFYTSSGESSLHPGRWFPIDGIYGSSLAGATPGWFVKSSEQFSPGQKTAVYTKAYIHNLYKQGIYIDHKQHDMLWRSHSPEFMNIGQKVGEARARSNAGATPMTFMELNSSIGTDYTLQQNRDFLKTFADPRAVSEGGTVWRNEILKNTREVYQVRAEMLAKQRAFAAQGSGR
jgi:hypothetical protein